MVPFMYLLLIFPALWPLGRGTETRGGRFVSPLQGNAICINCRESKEELLTSTEIDAKELGLTTAITFSWWSRPHNDNPSSALLGLYTLDDSNFMQPLKNLQTPDFLSGTNFAGNDKRAWRRPFTGQWRHMAATLDTNTGQVRYYVDGGKRAEYENKGLGVDISAQRGLILEIGQNFGGYTNGDPALLTLTDSCFAGQADEIRIYNRTLTEVEMRALGNITTGFGASNATKNDPSLILHYTFDDVNVERGDADFFAQNHGSGGSKYNLVPRINHQTLYTIQEVLGDCSPRNQAKPPLVITADDKPAAPVAANFTARGIEDSPLSINVFAREKSYDPSGSFWRISITKLPQSGVLSAEEYICIGDLGEGSCKSYDTGPSSVISHTPEILNSDMILNGWLQYLPNQGGSGKSFDSFSYKLINDFGMESYEGTVKIDLQVIDDTVAAEAVVVNSFPEDSQSPIEIELKATDEENDIISFFISKLPQKGTLFLSPIEGEEPTNMGGVEVGPPVTAPYTKGSLIGYTEQYVRRVVSVSSFWGSPPYAGYHAMNVIGSPMCVGGSGRLDSECSLDRRSLFLQQNGKWERKLSIDDIGELVLVHRPGGYAASPGTIVGVDPEMNLVNVSVTVLHKTVNGIVLPCIIDKEYGAYPKDCNTSLANAKALESISGEINDVFTFQRSELHGIVNGVWSPLSRNFNENVQKGGDEALAFGSEYAFTHHQPTYYESPLYNPPYTEYIEVSFESKVYPTGIVIGCPYGCYTVVAVRAKYEDSKGNEMWIKMFTGEADAKRERMRNEMNMYAHFNPSTCQAPFKTNTIRIELDTTSKTGIGGWNYIDYIQLQGAMEMQRAVLRYPNRSVYYMPHKHANGIDSFEYKASDCLGNAFRATVPTNVIMNITAENDPPIVKRGYEDDIVIHTRDKNGVQWSDADANVSMYDIFDNVDEDILQFGHSGGGEISQDNVLSFTCPLHAEEYTREPEKAKFKVTVTATDSHGASAQHILKFHCVYVRRNRLNGGLTSFGYALGILNITVSLACIFWTYKNGSVPVVRYAQRHFLILIAIGCILSSSSIFFLSIEDTEGGDHTAADLGCQLLPWTYSIGFVTTFASLFAKLRKVHILSVAAKEFVLIRVTVGKVLMWILGFLAVDAIFLLLWATDDPMLYRRDVLNVDGDGFATETAGFCTSEKGQSFMYFGIIMGLHFLLLSYGNYIAYMCRNLNGAFAETKYISIAMVSNIQVLLLGIPIILIVQDDVAPNYFVRVGVVFLNDFTVLALIFFPKILHVSFGIDILPKEHAIMSGNSYASTVDGGTNATEPSSI